MTTLVTGADGLLGSHVVRELLTRGAKVRAMVQPASTSPTLEGLGIERVTGDLLSAESVRTALRGVDRVVHCAALTDQFAPTSRHWAVNFDGTRNVVEACLAESPIRLVLVGSASTMEFGTIEHPGDERGEFPAAYRGAAYVESKHAAMELVRDRVANGGLDASIVAPTFLLGDHDWRPSSGELLLGYLRNGLRLVPPGGRNFAYAPDVAAATVNALDKAEPGDTTILGGHNVSYDEFFSLLAECAGAGRPRGVVPAGALAMAGRVGDVAGAVAERFGRGRTRFGSDLAGLAALGCYYDNAKARRELDMATAPIRTAIRASLQSLRTFGHLPADPLEGTAAVVSGASRGVGLALARTLGARGVSVVMTARGQRRLFESHRELLDEGSSVFAVAGDVGRWDDAESMVEAAIDRFGRLDTVVNNAGVSMRGQFSELSPEVCAQTINTNLLGAVYLSRAAAPHVEAAGGHIVFVSSIAGLIGLPGASTYCASKMALSGLAESLRLELGGAGVHVGVAYIGFTEHDPEKRVLGAQGEALLPDRPAHQSQQEVADAIVAMIDRRRRQVVLTPIGRVGELAHRLSPTLVEKAITKAQASDAAIFRDFA